MKSLDNDYVEKLVKSSTEFLIDCYKDKDLREENLLFDGQGSDPRREDLNALSAYLDSGNAPSYAQTSDFLLTKEAQKPGSVQLESLFGLTALIGAMCRADKTTKYINTTLTLYKALWLFITPQLHDNAAVCRMSWRGKYEVNQGFFHYENDPVVAFTGDIDTVLKLISVSGFCSFFFMAGGNRGRYNTVQESWVKLFVKQEYTNRFFVDVLTTIRKPTLYSFASRMNNYPQVGMNTVLADAQAVYDETIKDRKFLPSLLHVIADLGFLLDSYDPFNMELFAVETSENSSFEHVVRRIRSEEEYVRTNGSAFVALQRKTAWQAAERACSYQNSSRAYHTKQMCRRAMAIIGGYSPEIWK